MSEAMERPQQEPNPEQGQTPGEQFPGTPKRSAGFEGSGWSAGESAAGGSDTGPVVNYCRTCGRGLRATEFVALHGAVYCSEHAPRVQTGYGVPAGPPPLPPGYRPMEAPNPYATPGAPLDNSSPGLAFVLGLVPGVGAVYNAQYVKAIVHVVVLGVLISILSAGAADGFEPLFALLIAIWYFYMPFEAYHTAKKRSLGIAVDDVSSLFPMRNRGTGFPMGPVVLIGLGVVFLLAQFDMISFATVMRYWPVALILAGGWMLWERMAIKGEQS